ncbi:MAG TPA: hypothetical protein VGC19_10345 [Rhodanobacter sp.]
MHLRGFGSYLFAESCIERVKSDHQTWHDEPVDFVFRIIRVLVEAREKHNVSTGLSGLSEGQLNRSEEQIRFDADFNCYLLPGAQAVSPVLKTS